MNERPPWPLIKLGEIAEEITVGYVGPMTREYKTDGIPFLRSKNIKPYFIDINDIVYISPDFHKKICKSKLNPGDVVIVRTGVPGTSLVIPEEINDANCADMVIVRPGKKLNPYFLAFYLNHISENRIQRFAVGGVQQHFNVSLAKELEMPFPKKWEQDIIGHILEIFNRKIELNQKMNRTLDTLGQAIFKSWFVDFDPVRAKIEGREPTYMDNETAALFPDKLVWNDELEKKIPNGWGVASIEDIARYVNGKNFTKDATGTGRMVVRIAELNSGPGNSTIYNNVEAKKENIALPGDILFAWSGSLNIYRWHRNEALVNQHIFKVICEDYPPWFVYYHLKLAMPFFQDIASDKATTIGHIKRHHLKEALLIIPKDNIMKYAHKVLSTFYDLTHQNEVQSLTLADIRDTLLPKLMSGEIPVDPRIVKGVA